jgi:hypothetical protein
MHAHEVRACEMHAYEVHAMRCTPVRYTSMRCTPMRYTPMRCIPVRCTPMRCTPVKYSEGAGSWTTTTRGEDRPEEKDWERMLDCLFLGLCHLFK